VLWCEGCCRLFGRRLSLKWGGDVFQLRFHGLSSRSAGAKARHALLKRSLVSSEERTARAAARTEMFSATAARMSACNASSSILSPSWISMARLTLPSRLEFEEARRVLQRGAVGEGHLHDSLVRLTGADDSGVLPHRNPSPPIWSKISAKSRYYRRFCAFVPSFLPSFLRRRGLFRAPSMAAIRPPAGPVIPPAPVCKKKRSALEKKPPETPKTPRLRF